MVRGRESKHCDRRSRGERSVCVCTLPVEVFGSLCHFPSPNDLSSWEEDGGREVSEVCVSVCVCVCEVCVCE